jgi:hypothetical protein
VTKRSNPAATKFNRCTLIVRGLPLERFRLQRDSRKWKQAARSRYDLLLKLATYANPDGTFESEDHKNNFSPSTKKLQQHYAKRTLYRLANDLSLLGLLSWEREKNHYGRRTYRIHFQPEKQVPHSQDQVPHSQDQVPHSQKTRATMAPVNKSHHGTCYQVSHSPELKQSTALAANDGRSLRLLESLPSTRPGAVAVSYDQNDRRRPSLLDTDDLGIWGKEENALSRSLYASAGSVLSMVRFTRDAFRVGSTPDVSAAEHFSPDTQLDDPETPAAFLAIGHDKPFGHTKFQEVWLRHFASWENGKNGKWLTEVMEATIQECQRKKIGFPRQFTDAKRDVENRDDIEFEKKHGKAVPL